jgi:glycosyltransferase involved in cell wall biosynthesis
MPLLYHGAEVFVYPSIYEGFGIPPLEAMSCGVPVITSNSSSLPEVVGDAGVMVEPEDVESLAREIERVHGDPALRDQMRERGLAQAATFTWRKSAEKALAIYRSLL